MTAPLLPLATAFAGGIGLGLLAPVPPWLPVAGGLLAALTLVAIWRGRALAATASLLLLVALAGWARTALPDPVPALRGLEAGPARVEGFVSGDAETEGPRTRLPLLVTGRVTEAGPRPASGTLLLHLYRPTPALRPGDRIRLNVELTTPRPFRNPGERGLAPGLEPRNPSYLALGRAESIERLAESPAPWPLRVRLGVHRLIQRELPPVSGALMEGLLIGERRQLPPTLLADFRAAGVFHILAISGFNVALVAGAVFFLLRLLHVPPRAAAAVALGALAAFVLVVGAQASVLRATVMGGLMLAARLLRRESGVWNSLAAALIVLLALDPDGLLDAGLLLSFAATAGILHLSPPLRRRLGSHGPRWLAEAVAVSLGAQLAVTPIMLALWNQLSLIGIVANLVVVPLATALTLLGLLALLVATVSDLLAHLVFQSLWALLLGLRYVVRGFAAVPGAVLYLPTPPFWALVTAALALVIAPLASRTWARTLVAGLVGGAVLATTVARIPDGRLHVIVIDVGQGDAILVRGPDGRALLVDTGGGGPGRLDRGGRVVLPLLRHLGVARLHALAVTHGDPDHAGGLVGLLEGLPIDEVWVPAGTEEEAWQAPIDAAGVPRRVLARGERRWLGPLLITVLNPPRSDTVDAPPARRANNRSLVLRIDWGLAGVVLTGDAEVPAEREMLASGLPIAAPILKVGHHGSRYGSSSGFLTAVGPRLAAISVGVRNPFGHPNPAVLARLDAAGAIAYRTDLDGAVEVTSDAERLWIRRWAYPTAPGEFLLRGAP